MSFHALTAQGGGDPLAEADPVPLVGPGRNSPPQILRRTTITLHLELRDDGAVQVTSGDMPWLALCEHDPRRLFRDVCGALRYELRRRFQG